MSKFFIERPIFANVIALVILLLGGVALYTLPIAQYPDIVPPTIEVTTAYPGASARVVADTVGLPIEKAVNGVEDALYLSSNSGSDGSYTLTITFGVGTDLNKSLTLVQNLVNGATSQLPETVRSQGVTVKKVSTNMLMVVNLFSKENLFDEAFLTNYAVINIQDSLARLPGVGEINVVGAGSYSMRIWLDPTKLRYYGLTTLEVVDAIKAQNAQVVAGQIGGPPVPDTQMFQYTINAVGRLSDVEQFGDIVVKARRSEAAEIVQLRDVARIELSQETFANFSKLRGDLSTNILVYLLPGANALDVANAVRAKMSEFEKAFPPGLTYEVRYDTTRFIEESITAVYHTLFEAGFLVLIVITIFLQNLRATLVPATTVPITIVGAFAAMAVLGYSINLMTLFALILAIGIVVDDAIIIVENASRYIEKGLTPKDAAIKAMDELTGPVIGITLVLTAVFVPAAFMPGITGQLFRQFALVIAATAVISALNALTLKPVQCALYLKPNPARPNMVYRAFNRGYDAVERVYVGLVRRMVRYPLPMALVFAVVIGLTAWQFARQPTGFLPIEDQGYAIIAGKLPDGAAQPRVRATTAMIDGILADTAGVDAWVTIGGLSIFDGANLSNAFTIFVVFDDWSKRGDDLSQQHIVDSIQQRLFGLEDAFALVLVPPPIAGLGSAEGFQMMVQDRTGLGPAELEKAVHELVAAANTQSSLGGVATPFSARSPQLFLDIDRSKIQSLETSLADVLSTLQTALGSSYINDFNRFNQTFQVRAQADAPFRTRPEDIADFYVRNRSGDMVPLGAVITVRPTLGAELVNRYNLYPAASVFGAAAPGFSSGEALKLMEQVAEQTLPAGMGFEWTSTSFQEKLVGNQAYLIYALSLVLVYLVLAAQYESWRAPAAVIVTVPMALLGVLLALMARGFDNNLYTQVGLVLMIALAAKNAILIVEVALELQHHERMSPAQAVIEATRRRFRPILMTSFAFILGVVPLVTAVGAGAASQQALGTVVFGGMLSSTLLAIPFVSVFYVLLEGRRPKLAATVPETASLPAAVAPPEPR